MTRGTSKMKDLSMQTKKKQRVVSASKNQEERNCSNLSWSLFRKKADEGGKKATAIRGPPGEKKKVLHSKKNHQGWNRGTTKLS